MSNKTNIARACSWSPFYKLVKQEYSFTITLELTLYLNAFILVYTKAFVLSQTVGGGCWGLPQMLHTRHTYKIQRGHTVKLITNAFPVQQGRVESGEVLEKEFYGVAAGLSCSVGDNAQEVLQIGHCYTHAIGQEVLTFDKHFH